MVSIRLAAFTFTCALAASGAMAQSIGTLQKIKQSGEIVFGYRESAIPFSYIDANQNPVGFSIDLCNRIAAAVRDKLSLPSLKVKFEPVTASNRVPLLVNGAVDVECGSTTNTLERQKSVDFLNTTYVSGTRIMVQTSSNIASIADLKDKAIAVTAGTNNIKAVQQANQAGSLNLSLVYGKDHAESFLMLQNGRVSAFSTDDVLLYSIRAMSRNPAGTKVVGPLLSQEPYGLMIRRNDDEFKKFANDVLGGMFGNGEFKKTYYKWFNAPIPPKNINLSIPMSPELEKLMAAPNSHGV
ncbi:MULTISPECIES: amino acid ABC transporter substrate-binding protein [unclassified Herbaspirillum]|uniref:amino acid ABC transporter substrate-binding protein n=1 Tax=unclassified Herbaspirillum TaxID=2624150 RepID=UPI00383B845F